MMRMEPCGRIDIGVADHELFENVVLDGSAQLARCDSLLLGGDDVERHDWQHRAVHGHRNRHLVERNLVEEDLHVEDGVDGHAGLADIAGDALVVGVVAAMRGQIEGDRQAVLSGGEIAAIEGVRLFRGGEAGILANGPGPHDVHGAVGPAQIWRNAGGIFKMLQAGKVFAGVEALDRDVLGREP